MPAPTRSHSSVRRCRADENPRVQRIAFACCALLFAAQAGAGTSGSVALTSDYRFRGASLSDGLPSLQFDLDWAVPQGWYAGVFAASVRLPPYDRNGLQGVIYAGYSRPFIASWNWEAGTVYSRFTRDREYDYPEAYLGLLSPLLQLRVHYARHYFGQGPAELYLELDGTRELDEHWRLLGHVGVLRRDGMVAERISHYRYDARAGLGARFGAFDWQLAWVGSAGGASYAFGYPARASRRNVVLSVSREW